MKKKLVNKPIIEKIFCVNIVHIPEEDRQELKNNILSMDDDADDPRFFEMNGNYCIRITTPICALTDKWDLPDVEWGYSDEFQTIVAEARRLNCEYVCVSKDGPIYEELPRFELENK